MTWLIKCNRIHLLNFKDSFYVAHWKVKYIYWKLSSEKKKTLSMDNGNILNLDLNNRAIWFQIVHFECESVF